MKVDAPVCLNELLDDGQVDHGILCEVFRAINLRPASTPGWLQSKKRGETILDLTSLFLFWACVPLTTWAVSAQGLFVILWLRFGSKLVVNFNPIRG